MAVAMAMAMAIQSASSNAHARELVAAVAAAAFVRIAVACAAAAAISILVGMSLRRVRAVRAPGTIGHLQRELKKQIPEAEPTLQSKSTFRLADWQPRNIDRLNRT